MVNDTQDKKHPVPYIAWKTFTAFIASIHGKVPAQVDASILRTMSGTARSQLLSALKFLDLIDADGITQDSLKKLADIYNTEQWKAGLATFLTHSYKRVVTDLDLTSATPAMLRERFRNNGGVDGSTVDSALRFYLSGLKEADVKFSDHLNIRQRAPKGSTGNGRRRTIAKATMGERDENDGFGAPEGTFEIPFTVLGLDGSVFLPEDVSQERWAAISQYVDMVIGLRLKAQARA
jgi:hypothetical protein